MPINVSLLKERIDQCGLTVKKVSSALGIDESTYYRKMACDGQTFSIAQVQVLTKLLGLSKKEASEIFLP